MDRKANDLRKQIYIQLAWRYFPDYVQTEADENFIKKFCFPVRLM